MKRYHINSRGDAGVCRAFAGECPFGTEQEHHSSPEKAREAFEKAHGSSFGSDSKHVKVGRFQLANVAATSTDPDELMAVAQSGNTRAIEALSKNPAATADALVEARTKNAYATSTMMALEDHPNYPVWAMSNPGLTRKTDRGDFSGKNPKDTLFASSEVNGAVMHYATMIGNDGHSRRNVYDRTQTDFVNTALSNPHNRVTSKEALEAITWESDKNTSQPGVGMVEAATKGGKFPDPRSLSGHRLGFYNEKDGLPPAWVAESLPHQKDPELIQKSVDYLSKNNALDLPAMGVLLRNEATPDKVRDKINAEMQRLKNLLEESQ